jgi:hypothetical protein
MVKSSWLLHAIVARPYLGLVALCKERVRIW